MSKRVLVGAAAVIAIKVALLLMFRRWYLRWRATDAEVDATLPGDDLLPAAELVATRAIAVDAPAHEVWPWLAQLGQGRGGLYSYDFLENAVARCDIHSVDRIVPEWQQIAAGDQVRIHPKVPLDVAIAEPDRALVLRGGAPDGEPPSPYDFTWAFVLNPEPDGTTRLVMRERYSYNDRWAPLMVEPIATVSFVMSQKMLRGIRDRAVRRRASVEDAV
jgi:hypothetical protein